MYTNEKKYLVSNILYFTEYINQIHIRILNILSITKINIILVTLKPIKTFDEYIWICKKLNLKTEILKDTNIIKKDFLKILKTIYDNEYDCIYDLFIDNITPKTNKN